MSNELQWPRPGEILLHEFLEPMQITQYRLVKELGVSQRRIGEIVAGKRGVSVDTGLRLSRFFGTTAGFWTGLQLDFDTREEEQRLAVELAHIRPLAPDRGHRPGSV